MKKGSKFIIIMIVSLMTMGTTIVTNGYSTSISAQSAIVLDSTTGRVLYEKSSSQRMPMASTTKIMTALVALENSNLEEVVEIPKEAVGVEGSSIYLGYDEKVKMKDLLYGLMLRSGNDSAVAIAIHVGGSMEDFIDLMNKKAKEIGASNTNFTNPNGLHHNDHYTTAYDLALITREAFKNGTFKEIVKTKLYVAEREGYKYFYNKNKTLNQYHGGDGVKTGYTMAAGRCLVTSATRDGMQLICVVLNAPNWFQDSYNLLDYAFENYNASKVISKEAVLKNISIKNGKKSQTGVVSQEDVVIPLKDGEVNKLFTVFELDEAIEAPLKRGAQLGKAKIYLEDRLLYNLTLYSREDIDKKDFRDQLSDYFNEKFKKE